MNIGCALLVSINDDLVDKLDHLIVRGCRGNVFGAFFGRLLFHAGQQVADTCAIINRSCGRTATAAKEQVKRSDKLAGAAYLIDDLDLRVNVIDDLGTADFFRIRGHHYNAVFRVVNRYPRAAFEEFPAHVLEQVDGLDAIGLIRFIWHAEVGGKRLADGIQLDLELVDQYRFDVEVLATRRARRKLEFLCRDHGIRNQMVVLALDHHRRLLALPEGNSQCLAYKRRALLHYWREWLAGIGVDDLHHAD